MESLPDLMALRWMMKVEKKLIILGIILALNGGGAAFFKLTKRNKSLGFVLKDGGWN